ncbi:MAG: aminoglycoside phosphotransferase family protein [Deltaproteobacteria bacterium]|nr:aminoglycoside phosphotransferase family protein [Deltaproteobacteria bacterium]
MPPSHDEFVDAVVHLALEAAGVPRPWRIQSVPEGIGNHVFFVGDELVVRVGTGTDGAKFPAAIAVLRAAAGVVRVPEVVHADMSCTVVPYPVMVLRRLPGRPLCRSWSDLDAEQRISALERLMEELDRLHRVPDDRVPDSMRTVPWWARREAFIRREIRRQHDCSGFPTEWLSRMERYLDDNFDALGNAPLVGILHGDPGWGNVLFDGAEFCGLIDLDETRYGPSDEDSWQVLFEAGIEAEQWIPAECLALLPGLDLSAPGVLERYVIRETENILLLLTGELSWKTPEEAREDAHETYRDAFDSDDMARLLEQLV